MRRYGAITGGGSVCCLMARLKTLRNQNRAMTPEMSQPKARSWLAHIAKAQIMKPRPNGTGAATAGIVVAAAVVAT